MKALICGKWELSLPSIPEDSEDKLGKEWNGPPYHHRTLSETTRLSGGALCYEWLLSKIQDVETVIEAFGGIGRTTKIIQEVLKPQAHFVWELSKDLALHLTKIYPQVQVICGDSIKQLERRQFGSADLVCLDFHSFTLKKHYDNPTMMSGVFEQNPKYVLLTDCARSKIHLLTKVYSRLTSMDIRSWGDYCEFGWEDVAGMYNYGIMAVASHSGAGYILFRKNYIRRPEFESFQGRRDGFKIIKG